MHGAAAEAAGRRGAGREQHVTRALLAALLVLSVVTPANADGRKGSHRVGGAGPHGRGSHYAGGHRPGTVRRLLKKL